MEAETSALPRNGSIRFARWDGGPIEVAKGFLSGWYYMGHPDSIHACTNWYSEETVALLEQAEINWVWVTWSNGFSLKGEENQREIVRRYVAMCHRQGIKVVAYMSMTNMFPDEMFASEPRSRDWIQRDEKGDPIPYRAAHYEGRVTRYLGCLNHPGWQDYLLKRVESASLAGADGIEFDNMFSNCRCSICEKEFAAYCKDFAGETLSWPDLGKPGEDDLEVQRVQQIYRTYKNKVYSSIYATAASAARRHNPDILVFGNFNEGYGIFRPAVNNAVSTEDGREPGIADGDLVTNIGLLRSVHAASAGFAPVFVEYGLGRGSGQLDKTIPARGVGSSRFVPMTPRKHQLSLAEAASHGAALEITPEGWFLNDLFFKRPPALENWEAISQYNRFFRENQELYVGARSVARVAVLVNEGVAGFGGDRSGLRVDWLNRLAKQKILFDVVLSSSLVGQDGMGPEGAARIKGYDVLIVPGTRYFSEELRRLVAGFASRGTVIATKEAGQYDEKFRRRETGALQGVRGVNWSSDEDVEQIAKEVARLTPEPLVRLAGPHTVLYNTVETPDGRLVVHILNYLEEAAPRVRVHFNETVRKVLEISPDYEEEVEHECLAELETRPVRIYSVLCITR